MARLGEVIHFDYEHRGTKRKGWYDVSSGMVRVTTEFGTKATQVGGSPAETLARIMARELAQDAGQ